MADVLQNGLKTSVLKAPAIRQNDRRFLKTGVRQNDGIESSKEFPNRLTAVFPPDPVGDMISTTPTLHFRQTGQVDEGKIPAYSSPQLPRKKRKRKKKGKHTRNTPGHHVDHGGDVEAHSHDAHVQPRPGEKPREQDVALEGPPLHAKEAGRRQGEPQVLAPLLERLCGPAKQR
jgi:hypothetical protein